MLRLVNVHNETSETGMSIIHTNEKTNQMYVLCPSKLNIMKRKFKQ